MAPVNVLRVGSALRRGELTIIPVERSRVTVTCDAGRLLADARKEVAAVVVVTPAGVRALGTSGEIMDLAALIAQASGLRQALPA